MSTQGSRTGPHAGAPLDAPRAAPGVDVGDRADRDGMGSLGGHVLVVDDDELIQELVRAALEEDGHRVTLAGDGRAALDALGEEIPDLVVSDVNMPGLDGFELLGRLRTDPATRWVPVLMLTTRRGVEDVVAGLALGADDYLTKPFAVRELQARVRAKLDRPPVPMELLAVDRPTGLLTRDRFDDEVTRELLRRVRGGAPGAVAVMGLAELAGVELRLGRTAADEAVRAFAEALQGVLRPLDLVARLDGTHIGVLMPETTAEQAEQRLRAAMARVAETTVEVSSASLRATPSVGFVSLVDGGSAEVLVDRATVALDHAAAHLDLVPRRWDPRMDAEVAEARARADRLRFGPAVSTWARRIRTPVQVALSVVLGLVVPFVAYWQLDEAGVDVTPVVYVVVVVSLAATGFLIWLEGVVSLRRVDPPEEPVEPYPSASAVIAAYLPNEAATIVETLEAFLQLDYPAPLQVVLAYNTPAPMPIERMLEQLGEQHDRLTILRVEGSTSKAQNVNAALSMTTGTFVGVFDADHHPDADSFRRAWRWLSSGYDVVQGHCLVRNADASFVARMVAVEFEGIYAVSHPGRARLHDFGIFGGSNGYWRTDLLHTIRMRGSMLTEDIDSSLRVLENGGRVRSDPWLVSRELATTTLRQVWNQRMRWAQGWFQVSLRHLRTGLRSRELTLRQKLGLVHLLGWRELYPWLSWQMFPIIAYWVWRGDALDWAVPIFVMTSLFTLSVGPFQTWFAYRNADPQVRADRRAFWWYLLWTSVFYTEFKNVIARVSQLKELMGEADWRVTPRSGAAEED